MAVDMRKREDGKESVPASPTLQVEKTFWEAGQVLVAGLDEAGRGPWAGPVTAAAVILPYDSSLLSTLETVRDSKMLTPGRRERCYLQIIEVALAVGVGRAETEEIDAVGIVPATRLAMLRALGRLEVEPQALILDALSLPAWRRPQRAFPRADATSLSVAAASIMAKVTRDRWMVEVAEMQFPGYGFARHKGYGTRQHREALDRLGVCALHRRTFRPISELIKGPDGF